MRGMRVGLVAALATLSLTGVAQVPERHLAQVFEPATANCAATDTPCRDWLRFRRFAVGPYQSFAVAPHGDRATVVISEPSAPRTALLALVDAAFNADLIARSYLRWSTGLDGWLEDLVLDVRVPDARVSRVVSGHDLMVWSAPARIVDRLQFLHAGLYGTPDGFWVDNIDALTPRASVPSIPEPSALAGDLIDWLTDSAHTWNDVTGAGPLAFRALTTVKTPKVYVRSDGLLVALAIPQKTGLLSLPPHFRRFSVASDLILGAFQSNGTTWILGRSRQLPLTTLPPLRFETLASFLRERTSELAQSYERRRIFAGRVQSGDFAGWDWAPILLSRQLDDSEFGTLLNHADQILKSWSQAGSVDYYSFAHPKPSEFPFGRQPASLFFARELGTSSLVFNWNTQRVSTIHHLDGGQLLSVDRFAALPVLYIPYGQLLDLPAGSAPRPEVERGAKNTSTARDAAARARHYFATLGDPVLVRVAQNVLLYHISQAFLTDVAAAPQAAGSSRFDVVSGILREEAAKWLQTVAAAGPTPGMDRSVEATLERAIRSSSLTIDQLAEAIATPQVTYTKLSGLSLRFQHLAQRQDEVEAQYKVTYAAYQRAFDDFCKAVKGTLSEGFVRGGRDCKYNPANLDAVGGIYDHLQQLERTVKGLFSDLNSIQERQKTAANELVRAVTTFKQANSLGELVSGEAADTVELDRILARIRRDVAGEPAGSIRTPALVLSRNVERRGWIGGHNIDFDPISVRVPPPSIAGPPRPDEPFPSAASLPRSPRTAPARGADPSATLKATRPATLLDEIRGSRQAAPDPPTMARLKQDASRCGCEALVVQTADGQFLFARHGPPSSQQVLAGSPALVEVLTKLPRGKVVRFDGFADSPGLLESVMQSTELAINAAAPESRFPGLTRLAARIFRGDGESTVFAVGRGPDRPPQIFRVAGLLPRDADRFMSQPVSWRAASVRRGTVTTLDSGYSSTTTFVSPGAGAKPSSGPIGVEAWVGPGREPIAPAGAEKATRTILAAAGPGDATIAGGLSLLRDAIERLLKTEEVTFFVESTPIRISRRLDAQSATGVE